MAVVVGLRIAVSVWWMITHFGGPLQGNAIVTLAIGIFVLWALDGIHKSDAYFAGQL